MHLSHLRTTLDRPGPFATVCFERSGATQESERERESRWRALEHALTEQGAAPATVKALDSAVHAVPAGELLGAGRFLVADASGVAIDQPLGAGGPDRAHWSPVPLLHPLVVGRARSLPHVLVVADRIGADIVVRSAASPDTGPEEGETVNGAD
jgi:hypothetical protein